MGWGTIRFIAAEGLLKSFYMAVQIYTKAHQIFKHSTSFGTITSLDKCLAQDHCHCNASPGSNTTTIFSVNLRYNGMRTFSLANWSHATILTNQKAWFSAKRKYSRKIFLCYLHNVFPRERLRAFDIKYCDWRFVHRKTPGREADNLQILSWLEKKDTFIVIKVRILLSINLVAN